MEALLGLVCVGLFLGLPAWAIVSILGAARRQRLLEERACLIENWQFEREEYFLRINLPSMTAQERGGEYLHIRRNYEVARSPSGDWAMRLIPESYAEELTSLRELQHTAARSFIREKLAKAESGRHWEPVAEALRPSLETAYQRYIHNT